MTSVIVQLIRPKNKKHDCGAEVDREGDQLLERIEADQRVVDDHYKDREQNHAKGRAEVAAVDGSDSDPHNRPGFAVSAVFARHNESVQLILKREQRNREKQQERHKDVERLLACPKQQQRPNHTPDQACRKQHHHPFPLADEIAALGECSAEVSRTQCNRVRYIRGQRWQFRRNERWK
jgi:hypothetical protein